MKRKEGGSSASCCRRPAVAAVALFAPYPPPRHMIEVTGLTKLYGAFRRGQPKYLCGKAGRNLGRVGPNGRARRAHCAASRGYTATAARLHRGPRYQGDTARAKRQHRFFLRRTRLFHYIHVAQHSKSRAPLPGRRCPRARPRHVAALEMSDQGGPPDRRKLCREETQSRELRLPVTNRHAMFFDER